MDFYPILPIIMKQTYRTRIIDKIFLGMLAVLLLLPGLRINHDEKSINENRMLATRPTLITNENKINNKFGIEYDRWFSDRFFGRDVLIKFYGLHGGAEGNLDILVEKDNWLFLNTGGSMRNFANMDRFTEQDLASIATYIDDIDTWCKKHNKQFVFIIAPDKNKIYGEHITKVIKKHPDSESRSLQLVEYLQQHTNATVLYPRDTLIAHKGDGLLYWKNDTHWNDYGAYIGYTEIMNALKIKPIKVKSFVHETKPRSDLTNMATNIPEDTTSVYLVPEIPSTEEIGGCNFASRDDTHCENKNYKVNKSVFVLRDSFSIKLGLYYVNTFRTVDSRWRYDIQKSDMDYIKNADIIILEVVERNINALPYQQFPKD